MRIAFDATAAVRPQRTGIGWYAAHLARELAAELEPRDALLLCTRVSRWKRRGHRPLLGDPHAEQRWFQGWVGPRGAPDVFHGPDSRLPGPRRTALVATVSDVFSLVSDRFAGARFRARKRHRYRDIARRADRIIFPSQAARREYLEFFPEAESRAVVVPHGVAREFAPQTRDRVAEVKARLGLPARYALYVGELSLRKNLPAMARGLALSGVSLPWVCVGRESFGADAALDAVRETRVSLVRPGYVPFADLPAVYSGADVLTFATSHEGFGMPALEAMACGTPVVASDRGALPEVVGDCALKVSPDDPVAIGEAIRRAVCDEDLARRLRARGVLRAADFPWRRTARETRAVYAAALAS
ncbi:MAG TPA: glycosyltransferase family 1 protein [Myxococcota bacterium]|nr:glycosyltransferase family 1 protein [Myxococcota bacterium]